MNEIFNFVLSGAGAAAGIYGAVRAWLSNRKMKQIEEEKLSSKVSTDFTYDLIQTEEAKICRGIIKWSNLGLTNIKIIKLNIDIRDREDEMRESYLSPEQDSEFSFNPLSNKVKDIELVAINNHKLANFSNDIRKGEVKIFKNDPIYGLQLSSREKRKLKESGEEVEIDVLEIKRNINLYIDNKINRLKEIFSTKKSENFKKQLTKFLFYDTLVKELRGIQLFPQETKDQEFFLKYTSKGIVYLNVESATIRLQLKNINAIEEFKSVGDEIIDSQKLSNLLIDKFKNILTLIVSPAALEIHKQKSNYLIYLK